MVMLTTWFIAFLSLCLLPLIAAQGTYTCTDVVNAPANCTHVNFASTFGYFLYAQSVAGDCSDCPVEATTGPCANTSLLVGGRLDRYNLTGIEPSFNGTGPFCARAGVSLLVGGPNGGNFDFSLTGWTDSYANSKLCSITMFRTPSPGQCVC